MTRTYSVPNRKRLVFVSAFVPGPQTAGQKFSRDVLFDLAADFDVSVYCFGPYGTKMPSLPASIDMHVFSLNNARRLAGWFLFPFLHPFFTARVSWRVLWQLIKVRNSAEAFYFDFSQTFLYGLFLPGRTKFFMAHDVVTQKYARKKSLLLPWVRFAEKTLIDRMRSTVFVLSEKDRVYLGRTLGVSSSAVSIALDEKILRLPGDFSFSSKRFVFFGVWSRRENWDGLVWFVKSVLPLLDGGRDWRVIGGGLDDTQVEFLRIHGLATEGFLDDPYPLLRSSAALLAPLFQGAGVKVKVVEALACGTAVIGTDVALEGIDQLHKGALLAANTAHEFKNQIEALEMDSAKKLAIKTLYLSAHRNPRVLDVIRSQLTATRSAQVEKFPLS